MNERSEGTTGTIRGSSVTSGPYHLHPSFNSFVSHFVSLIPSFSPHYAPQARFGRGTGPPGEPNRSGCAASG